MRANPLFAANIGPVVHLVYRDRGARTALARAHRRPFVRCEGNRFEQASSGCDRYSVSPRLCTKSRRAKVRRGKNRRGSGVYVL
ncbi:hypothetical protein GIW26_06980 [Pseudomonas syringae]|nr:hypothetical protein [Pseudomonas syringae]